MDARILDGPSLTYEKEFGSVKDGSWNLRNGVRFHKCGKITSYGIASFAPEQRYGGPGPDGLQVNLATRPLRSLDCIYKNWHGCK